MRKFHEAQIQELKGKLSEIENIYKIENQKMQVDYELKIQDQERKFLKEKQNLQNENSDLKRKILELVNKKNELEITKSYQSFSRTPKKSRRKNKRRFLNQEIQRHLEPKEESLNYDSPQNEKILANSVEKLMNKVLTEHKSMKKVNEDFNKKLGKIEKMLSKLTNKRKEYEIGTNSDYVFTEDMVENQKKEDENFIKRINRNLRSNSSYNRMNSIDNMGNSVYSISKDKINTRDLDIVDINEKNSEGILVEENINKKDFVNLVHDIANSGNNVVNSRGRNSQISVIRKISHIEDYEIGEEGRDTPELGGRGDMLGSLEGKFEGSEGLGSTYFSGKYKDIVNEINRMKSEIQVLNEENENLMSIIG